MALWFALLLYGPLILLSLVLLKLFLSLSPLALAPRPELVRGLSGGLLLALFTVASSQVLVRSFAWAAAMNQEFKGILGPLSTGEALALALLSGLGEELFFRGVIQGALGLLPATFLFSLAHYPWKRALYPWTAFAFLLGLAMGVLVFASGSLWPAVLVHFLVNAINLVLLESWELPSRRRDELGNEDRVQEHPAGGASGVEHPDDDGGAGG